MSTAVRWRSCKSLCMAQSVRHPETQGLHFAAAHMPVLHRVNNSRLLQFGDIIPDSRITQELELHPLTM